MLYEISVDDGGILDLRVAELLEQYGLTGTFYIPTMRTELNDDQIIDLSKRHTIGSHTCSHPQDLKLLDKDTLMYELSVSKQKLEYILEKPVDKFCLPRGRYDQGVLNAVEKAGYTSCRTTKVFNTDIPNGLLVDTTIHIGYPRKEYEGLPWLDVAYRYLDIVAGKVDGYYHCWGHSQEINKLDEWDNLEKFFSRLSEHKQKRIS